MYSKTEIPDAVTILHSITSCYYIYMYNKYLLNIYLICKSLDQEILRTRNVMLLKFVSRIISTKVKQRYFLRFFLTKNLLNYLLY